jgi:hypothetical protein
VTDSGWATQLLGADTLSASRAVLNTNFNAARRHTITSIDNGDSRDLDRLRLRRRD